MCLSTCLSVCILSLHIGQVLVAHRLCTTLDENVVYLFGGSEPAVDLTKHFDEVRVNTRWIKRVPVIRVSVGKKEMTCS